MERGRQGGALVCSADVVDEMKIITMKKPRNMQSKVTKISGACCGRSQRSEEWLTSGDGRKDARRREYGEKRSQERRGGRKRGEVERIGGERTKDEAGGEARGG